MKILKFRTNSCSKCDILDLTIAEVNPKIEIETVYADIDVNKSSFFGVMQVPTMVMIDDEENEIKRHTGILSPEEIEAWIEAH